MSACNHIIYLSVLNGLSLLKFIISKLGYCSVHQHIVGSLEKCKLFQRLREGEKKCSVLGSLVGFELVTLWFINCTIISQLYF